MPTRIHPPYTLVTRKMSIPYAIVNAFTTSKSGGNPAAVVVLPSTTKDWPSKETLQNQATSFQQPMTAYLLPTNPSSGEYNLRWFNPASEQWICGHATVALSSHLFSQDGACDKLSLNTEQHGIVTSMLVDDPFGGGKLVAIEFPELRGFESVDITGERFKEVVDILREATGMAWGKDVGGEGVRLVEMMESSKYLLIEVDPSVDFGGIQFDSEKLVRLFPYVYVSLRRIYHFFSDVLERASATSAAQDSNPALSDERLPS